ncbi:hypothetical protein DXG01_007480 [Tephrocybe rancida]|nr:hypothetical protein DXG01_007480 [Tephrocybe rancida]
MSTPQANDGLLFVYGECGPHVTEEEFDEWYNNDHAPARVALPDFSTALRYKAVDNKSPSRLAIYDITTPDALQSDAYKALSINASQKEKSIISRLALLNRRIYRRFLTYQNPDFDPNSLPAKVTLVVGMAPGTEEKEEDHNRWYSEEHLALMSKVPGFIRARRYKFVSSVELAGNADPASSPVAFPYITLYDWESTAYLNEPAYKEAISTPWTVKVFSEVAKSEQRLFELQETFAK